MCGLETKVELHRRELSRARVSQYPAGRVNGGGTADNEINIKCVVILFDKGNSIEEIKKNNNIDIYTLVKIKVEDGKTIISKI